jgi:autotransporter-associated beta strand protein
MTALLNKNDRPSNLITMKKIPPLMKLNTLKLTAFMMAVSTLAPMRAGANTVYWRLANEIWAGGNSNWATTSGGAPSVAWVDGSSAIIEAINPTVKIYSPVIVDLLTIQNGMTLQMAFAGASRTLTINGGGSGNLTLAAVPIGTLTQDNSLNVFLNGTSAWSGTVQANFSNGNTNQHGSYTATNRIILGSATSTGTATKVSLGGGVMALNTALVNNTATIGELSGVSGSLITAGYNSSGTGGNRGLRVEQTTNTTYAGRIEGSTSVGSQILSFTKAGSGRLRLTGSNTYGGATSVEAGELYVNGTTSGQGTFSVSSGATLGGTGTIGLAGSSLVTVQNGGILNPGDVNDAGESAAGTFTLSGATSGVGLQFLGNATIKFDLSAEPGESDLIALTGSTMSGLALGGSGSIAFQFFAGDEAALVGKTFDLISFGTAPGINLDAFTLSAGNLSTGWSANFNYAGNTLQVNIDAIPEPSVQWLGAIGFVGGLLWLRRGRSVVGSSPS